MTKYEQLGYIWQNKDGKWYLRRCPHCQMENYAPSVSTGICVWCGFNANHEIAVDDK